MGWPVEADGLTELLLRLHEEYTQLPIYVTENGRAVYDYVDPGGDEDDEERVSYLDARFRAAPTTRLRGALTSAATWCGRCSTTSSGRKGTPSASASTSWTTAPG